MRVYHKRDNAPDAVLIDRTTVWGNPFILGKDGTRDLVIDKFAEYARQRMLADPNWLEPLRGKDLTCWCHPQRCHGDVLLKLANQGNRVLTPKPDFQYLVLDFETRSAVDIKKSSRLRYCSNKSTDILCVGMKYGEQVRVQTPLRGAIFLPGDPCPPEVLYCLEHGLPIVAHNAPFEMGIWEHVCVKKLGWPDVPYAQWHDTLPSCAYYSIPRKLEEAAKALNLVHQKDVKGGRIMLQVSKPRNPSAKKVKTWVDSGKLASDMPLDWWEDEERLQRVYDYCGDDVRAQDELYKKLGPLPSARQAEYDFDFRVNQRGIPIDWVHTYVALDIVEHSMGDYDRKMSEVTASTVFPNGMVTTVNQVKQLGEFCNMHGYPMQKVSARTGKLATCVDKEAIDNALDDWRCPQAVREALLVRQDAGKTSLGKLDTILRLTDPDMRVRDSLVWHGASTGRKAGRGIQPHNFPSRNCLKEKEADILHMALSAYDPFTALANAMAGPLRKDPPVAIPDMISAGLRSFMQAGDGRMFYVSDFATIEVRNLAWVTGCTSLLNAFASGECVYRQFAGKIYHIDPKSIEKSDPKRQMGKAAVLGLGYGMGEDKFKDTAKKQYQIDMPLDQAKWIKDLYRSTYTEVMEYHKQCGKAFTKAIKEHTNVPCGRVTFGCNGEWGWLVLPSGRPLWFREPTIRRVPNRFRESGTMEEISYMGIHPTKKIWTRRSTYGGSLVESICQGMTACILQEAMVRVENAGYPVVLTVHDEVVTEPEEHMSLDTFDSLMKVRPAWALDLPIEVESQKRKRYGK